MRGRHDIGRLQKAVGTGVLIALVLPVLAGAASPAVPGAGWTPAARVSAPLVDAVHGPVGEPAQTACGDRTPHPPIHILGDEGPTGFVVGEDPVTGEPIYRPGSGVIAGTGTAEDPYLIEGWCISPTVAWSTHYEQGAGIRLQDTTAHAVLRGNRVDGAVSLADGVLVHGASNVTVSNNTITANTWHAVDLDGSRGVTITNNTMTGNGAAVFLRGSGGATIAHNTIHDNWGTAVWLIDSERATIIGNTMTGNGHGHARYFYNGQWNGVTLTRSPGATIAHNVIADNEVYALLLHRSGGATLAHNTFAGNGHGVLVHTSSGVALSGNVFEGGGVILWGGELGHYRLDVDEPNTVNGAPLRYVADKSGVEVPAPAGQIIVVNATQVTVKGHAMTDASAGVQVAFSKNVSIADNTLTDHDDTGVGVHFSDGTTVTSNVVTGNGHAGVVLFESTRSVVQDNTVAQNGFWGLRVLYSTDGNVSRNTIADNVLGVHLQAGSDDNGLFANSITQNDHGVAIDRSIVPGFFLFQGPPPRGITLSGNNIEDNADHGLVAQDLDEPVVATDNWWGDGSGPSGDVRDACTGTAADGDGDRIATHEAEVCFSPWRTSSNTAAGA